MERKFKTGASNRENYVYYTANGSKIIIEPGKDGVDEEWIKKLRKLDHDEILANKREDYGAPIRIGKETDFENELKNYLDQNPYMADESLDPLEILMEEINSQERSEKMKKLVKALDELTPIQKQTVYKKFYLNMTNVAISLEEGVTETSIRHRLEKIYARISKFLKNHKNF